MANRSYKNDLYGKTCPKTTTYTLVMAKNTYEIVSSTSSSFTNSSETYSSGEDKNFTSIITRKHHSRSELKELDEHKTDNANVSALKDGEKHRRESNESIAYDQSAPPPADSNSEMLQTLKLSADVRDQTVEDDRSSGSFKASAVPMQLIGCGSRRAKECKSMEMKAWWCV